MQEKHLEQIDKQKQDKIIDKVINACETKQTIK